MWSEHGAGDTIRVTPAADDEAEAELVLHRISALKFERRAKYSDFAILYRGNHQARVFETALRAQCIPYDISGGQSLFDRTEIKDIVAYLRLIANDDDDPAFLRAVTTPRRGVGTDHAFAALRIERQTRRKPVRDRVRAGARGARSGEATRDAACLLLADQQSALVAPNANRRDACSTS